MSRHKPIAIQILLWVLIAVFLLAAGMVVREILIGQKEQQAFEELSVPAPPVSSESEEKPLSKVALLQQQYPDISGWIRIENTAIDYPVVHTPEHTEKYLRRALDGSYSRSGVPFLDGRISPDSPHLIIYGHNMVNGTMFSDLTKFTDPTFAAEHQTVLLSLPDEERRYRIFAVVETDGKDAWYSAMTFSSDEEYQKQISALSQRSYYQGELPKQGQLLTLSTCSGWKQTKRLLVVAAQID